MQYTTATTTTVTVWNPPTIRLSADDVRVLAIGALMDSIHVHGWVFPLRKIEIIRTLRNLTAPALMDWTDDEGRPVAVGLRICKETVDALIEDLGLE